MDRNVEEGDVGRLRPADPVSGAHAPVRPGTPAGVWNRGDDGRPVRLVCEPGGARTWRVWAAGCAHVPGAPAGDCLVFDAGEVVRRVWGVPPEWPALGDAALLALAARRPAR